MNEIDKLFADVNPIPIIKSNKTKEELKQNVKKFENMTMTPEEEAEFEEDVRNENVIFHI